MIQPRPWGIRLLVSLAVLGAFSLAFILFNSLAQPPTTTKPSQPLTFQIPVLKEGNVWLLSDGDAVQTQVTSEGNVIHIFGLSSDGQRILYGVGARPVRTATEDISGTDLWVIYTDGTEPRQLTSDLQVISAVWSSTGQKIAYVTRDFKLFIIEANGLGQILVTSNSSLEHPSWSHDDQWLAYVAYPDDWNGNFLEPENPLNIFLFEVASGQRRQLTFDESMVWNSSPQWPLDGSQVSFQTGESGRVTPYWRSINIDGSGLQVLEASKVVGTSVSSVVRSPTQDEVAFAGGGSWIGQVYRAGIWVMDFSGNARLLVEFDWEGPPTLVWLPDGVGLVWGKYQRDKASEAADTSLPGSWVQPLGPQGGEAFVVYLSDGRVQHLTGGPMTLPSAFYWPNF